MLTFIRYIEVNFAFALVDSVRYNEDFVKTRLVISRFSSIHFNVILIGLKQIVRDTEDFVTLRFVNSRFHCMNVEACICIDHSSKKKLGACPS